MMTLVYFTARSNLIAYVFELYKHLRHLTGKKLAVNVQIDRIFMLLKNNETSGLSAPTPGYIHVYDYYYQIWSKLLYCADTRRRCRVSVYRTIGPLLFMF